MRATVNGIEIEGTPEEIASFLTFVENRKEVPDDSPDTPIKTLTSLETDEITDKFAYRALRRLPLSAAQKALLGALRDAHPNWLTSSELQNALQCSPTSLGGVLGGLGRRVSATKGYETGYSLWEWKWDDDEGEWTYHLSDSVLSALDRVGV